MPETTAPLHPHPEHTTHPGDPDEQARFDREFEDIINNFEDETEEPTTTDLGTTPDTTPIPTTPGEDSERLKIVMVGLDKNIAAEAKEVANSVVKEKTKGAGFASFLGNVYRTLRYRDTTFLHGSGHNLVQGLKEMPNQIIHGNVFREGSHLYQAYKARQEMIESGNLKVHSGLDRAAYETAMLQRFGHDFDDLIHKAAGEDRIKISLDRNPDGSINTEGSKVKEGVVDLIQRYCAGEFTNEEDFREAEKRMMAELAQDPEASQFLDKAQIYAANLFSIAQTVKARVDADHVDVNEVLGNAEIILGEGRTGARTETDRTRGERIVEKLTHVPFLNEAVVATAVGAVYAVGGWSIKRTANIAELAAGVTLPGVVGGMVAGVREWNATRVEHRMLARELATGKYDKESLSGRARELADTLYDTKGATELIDQLGLLYDEHGDFRSTDAMGALQIIGEIEARIRISDMERTDLISFSAPDKVEQERFDLDLALAKAKVDFRRFLKNATDAELAAIGVEAANADEFRSNEDPLNVLLTPVMEGQRGVLRTSIMGEIDEDMAKKDKLYHKVRNKRVLKAALKGTIVGALVGTVVQEVTALAEGNEAAVFEGQNASGEKETFLHTVFEHRSAKTHHIRLEANAEQFNGHQTKVTLPEGYEMHSQGATATVTGPNGFHVSGIGFTKGGNLNAASVDALRSHGIHVEANVEHIQVPQSVETTHGAQDWLNNHKDMAHNINRKEWMENNTSAPDYDLNEQGLDTPYHDAHGNVIFNVNRMTANGSFEGSDAVNWHEAAANGQLKIALSLSDGTQSQVVEVPIDTNGNAIIPPGSPLQSLFTPNGEQTSNGHSYLNFQGKYMEVVQVTGTDAQGADNVNILATGVGQGANSFHDVVNQQATVGVQHYVFRADYTTPGQDEVLVSPTAPLYSRQGLNTPGPAAHRRTTATTAPTITIPSPRAPGSIGGGAAAAGAGAGAAAGSSAGGPGTPPPPRSGTGSRTGEGTSTGPNHTTTSGGRNTNRPPQQETPQPFVLGSDTAADEARARAAEQDRQERERQAQQAAAEAAAQAERDRQAREQADQQAPEEANRQRREQEAADAEAERQRREQQAADAEAERLRREQERAERERRRQEAEARAEELRRQQRRATDSDNGEERTGRAGNLLNGESPEFYREIFANYQSETRRVPIPEGAHASNGSSSLGKGIANAVLWRLIDADPSLNPSNVDVSDAAGRKKIRKRLSRRALKLLHPVAVVDAGLTDSEIRALEEATKYLLRLEP